MSYLTFLEAAGKCPLFSGPENKEVFKQVMLEVLKSTKQRVRNRQKTTTVSTSKEKSEETENIQKKIRDLKALIASKQSSSSADESEAAGSSSDADDERF